MTSHALVTLRSLSAAMDGGFTAIADVIKAMSAIGAANDDRLVGGVAVMLHVQRLRVDVPLRATGDADFGVPPNVLRQPDLIDAIESVGYDKVMGNRWERPIDGRRVAAVDRLVPAYRSRARDTVKIADVITTEVPGLAEAMQRPAVTVEADLGLTDGTSLHATIALPDAVAMLVLKSLVRARRNESRDAEDLWRCLEIAAADGVTPSMFDRDEEMTRIRLALWRELGPEGSAIPLLTADLTERAAARLRTHLRALLVDVVGAQP